MLDLEKLVNETGVKLYDTEVVNENSQTIYRIYILKEGGVNLSDCEKLSRLLSPIFDVTPPINGNYTLEVSSPGLERVLSKAKHFKLSIGELINVKFLQNGENRSIKGELLEADENKITIKHDKETITINLSDIKKAKTYIQW